MSRLFTGVTIDRVICSGMRRARETASRVFKDSVIEIEDHPDLREIRAARTEQSANLDLVADVAFGHWAAGEAGSRFLGGELYADFYARIATAMDRLTLGPDWHNLAIFAHGGTNAAIIGWTSGLGLSAFGVVDQASCCVNVLDFDFGDNDGRLRRKVVRAMNITADDPVKSSRHGSGMESLARLLISRRH